MSPFRRIIEYTLMTLAGVLILICFLLSCRAPVRPGQIYTFCSTDPCQELEVLSISYGTVLYRDQDEVLHTMPVNLFEETFTLEHEN